MGILWAYNGHSLPGSQTLSTSPSCPLLLDFYWMLFTCIIFRVLWNTWSVLPVANGAQVDHGRTRPLTVSEFPCASGVHKKNQYHKVPAIHWSKCPLYIDFDWSQFTRQFGWNVWKWCDILYWQISFDIAKLHIFKISKKTSLHYFTAFIWYSAKKFSLWIFFKI